MTYSNQAKEDLVKVSHDTLLAHGAVSEETVREMAFGASKLFGSSVSVAVSGIAGPGGATPEKPVGLVYIGVSDGSRCIVSKNDFKGDRREVRESTVNEALLMVEEFIEGIL